MHTHARTHTHTHNTYTLTLGVAQQTAEQDAAARDALGPDLNHDSNVATGKDLSSSLNPKP